MFSEKKSREGLIYLTSSVLPAEHAFSTRLGGAGTGAFESFNIGAYRGDDPDAVRENYRRWCALFAAGVDDCCVTNQVHGNAVRTVMKEDRHICMGHVPYEADGLVTAEKNLPIFCFMADCVPVLLCDKTGAAAGAVHCGWRSSAKDILGEAVHAMENLGAKDVPEALTAYLGGDTEGLWTLRGDGKYLVDLRKANARRLMQLGLREENIDISTDCTVCSHEKFWSARYTIRCGIPRGNMVAGIVLR